MKIRLPIDGPGVDRDDAETWPEVYVCDSQDHDPALATQLLHWVTGPVHYCDACAARMLRVAEVLGTHVAVESLPQPTTRRDRRAMNLSGWR